MPELQITPTRLDACPAPAKINLFLHVTGRRDDGYHDIQTAFRLLDWGDTLDFARREDRLIRRTHDIPGVPEAQDLVIRAAHALRKASGCQLGADITVHKILPMGGGLGGGSSDAATTLIALNHLWQTGLSSEALREIALPLGADVPFFIYGHDAFAEGVGERLQPLQLDSAHYVILSPKVSVPTSKIFTSPQLTRNTPPIKVDGLTFDETRNYLQAVAARLYPEVAQALS